MAAQSTIYDSSVTTQGTGIITIPPIGPWYGALGGSNTLNATISFESDASGPSDLLIVGETTLSGNVTFVSTDRLSNRIYGSGGMYGGDGYDTLTITQNSSLTLGGNGQMSVPLGGQGTLDGVFNQGTLDVSLKFAKFDVPIQNSGLFLVHDGAVVDAAANIQNSNGTITVSDNSTLRLSRSYILNGSIVTEGTGKVQIPASNANIGIGGVIDGNATISLEADQTTGASLLIVGATTLSGNFTLVSTDRLSNHIYGAGFNDSLTITENSRLTLGGSGQLDIQALSGISLNIHNQGTFDASLKFARISIPFINDGLFLVHGGAVVDAASNIQNSNGTITVSDDSTLRLSRSYILGGSIVTEGTGKVQIPASNANMGIGGVIHGNATFSLEADQTAAAALLIAGPTTLSGNFTLVSTDRLSNQIYGAGFSDSLTITENSQLTLGGGGQLDFLSFNGGTVNIYNHGTFDASLKFARISDPFINDGLFVVHDGAVVEIRSSFVNNGEVRVLADSTLQTLGGVWATSGDLTIGSLGAVTVEAGYLQNGGQARIDGILNSSFTLNGGMLSGEGVIAGDLVVNNGAVSPGSSAGALHIDGQAFFGQSSVLNIEVGGQTPGAQFDQVTVASSVSLSGVLDVTTINGFEPTLPGQSFQIITYSSHTGSFNDVLGAPSEALHGLFWTVDYLPGSVVLSTSSLPGDASLDGSVDFIDLGILLNNYDQLGNFAAGDFDFSGKVDFVDLGILLNNYNTSLPVRATVGAVPEPTTLMLATLGFAALLVGGRRGKLRRE